MTREEAASRLGWSAGAVKGMLERGRELLRSRLAQRGVALSVGSLAAMLSGNALSAAVPAVLSNSTVKTALVFAAGKLATAGSAAGLAEGVLQAMWMTRVKVWLAAALVLGLAVTGAWRYCSSPSPRPWSLDCSSPAGVIKRPAPVDLLTNSAKKEHR